MRVHKTAHKYISSIFLYHLFPEPENCQSHAMGRVFLCCCCCSRTSAGQLHAGNSFTWGDTGACVEMTGVPPGRGENPNSISWHCVTGNKSCLSGLPSQLWYRNDHKSPVSVVSRHPARTWHRLGFQAGPFTCFLSATARAESCGLLRRSEQLRADFYLHPGGYMTSFPLNSGDKNIPFGHILWKLSHPFSKCRLD